MSAIFQPKHLLGIEKTYIRRSMSAGFLFLSFSLPLIDVSRLATRSFSMIFMLDNSHVNMIVN